MRQSEMTERRGALQRVVVMSKITSMGPWRAGDGAA